jgi:hypothetical protein
LASEAEDGGFVRWAVADDESAAALGQAAEDALKRGAEPLRVVGDEFGIGLAQVVECAAAGLLVGGAPAVLDL